MQEQNLNEQLQQQAGDSDLQKAMEGIMMDKETGTYVVHDLDVDDPETPTPMTGNDDSLRHTNKIKNSGFSGEFAGGFPADRVAVLGGGSRRGSSALMASALAAAAAGNMASPFLGLSGMKRFTGSKVYRDIELTPMERMQRDMAVKTHNAQVEMQRKLKKDAKKARAEVKAALK